MTGFAAAFASPLACLAAVAPDQVSPFAKRGAIVRIGRKLRESKRRDVAVDHFCGALSKLTDPAAGTAATRQALTVAVAMGSHLKEQ